MDEPLDHTDTEDIWPETLLDCPPPRRWPADAVGYPMTATQQTHYDRIIAAAGVHPWELSETVRLVLRWLATGDHTVCDGLVELVERVHHAGFDEANDLALYPLYRADETVAVTITVGELTDRGLLEGAIGVGWADRDECARDAFEASRRRPVERRNLRGIVVITGMALDCDTCRDDG